MYRIQERMFLRSVIWVATISILIGSCLTSSQRGTEGPRILILGAGMSGVTVAKTLEEAGHRNFLLIEGSSRIGGRMMSANLSGHTVELGAMWVYGTGTNPIYKLLNDHSVSMTEDYPDTMTVRDTSGNDVTDMASDAQSRLDKAIEGWDSDSKDAINYDLPDFTIESRLRFHEWNAENEVDDVIETYNIDFEFGVPPEYLSGKYGYIWAPYDAFQSEELPIVNDQRGFESLAKSLANSLMQNGTHDDRIVLDKVVTNVIQNNEGVDVLTLDGSHYHGDYVVVTFSVGVLQSEKVNFSPDFPSCKQMAIDKFGMSPFTHIYLKFPSAFWDDTLYIMFASEQRGKYGIYVNMNYILPGSNILQLSVWGEESRRIERLDDQTIVDDILRHLRLMYPNHVIPFPYNHTISRWTYDPLTQGAYSYWPTGFTRDNMDDMMAPFGRVYFSGEHLDMEQYSFVHAAYTSGIRTATMVLACVKDQRLCAFDVDKFRCSQARFNEGCVSGAELINFTSSSYLLRWPLFAVALSSLLVIT